MKHITEFLLEKGYKPYSLIIKSNWNKDVKKQAQKILESNKDNVLFKEGDFNSDESIFYVPTSFNTLYHKSNYNSNNPGGLDTRFILNKDISTEIIYGLGYVGDPPTLVSPRPRINLIIENILDDRPIIIHEDNNVSVDVCLKKEKPEDIFKAMYDKSIVFEYNIKR